MKPRPEEFVLYAKRPFGGPKAVRAYLSLDTHRVAIANSRLIACDRTGVTFRCQASRAEGLDRQKVSAWWCSAFGGGYGLARISAFTCRRRLPESSAHSRRPSGPTHRGSPFR